MGEGRTRTCVRNHFADGTRGPARGVRWMNSCTPCAKLPLRHSACPRTSSADAIARAASIVSSLPHRQRGGTHATVDLDIKMQPLQHQVRLIWIDRPTDLILLDLEVLGKPPLYRADKLIDRQHCSSSAPSHFTTPKGPTCLKTEPSLPARRDESLSRLPPLLLHEHKVGDDDLMRRRRRLVKRARSERAVEEVHVGEVGGSGSGDCAGQVLLP